MNTTEKAQKIETIEQLRELARENLVECFIVLTGGLRSSKRLMYFPRNGEWMWYVWNLVDDTEQVLTEEQLLSDDYGNIGKALRTGNLYLNKEENRDWVIAELRRLADDAEGIRALLPTLPLKQWADGTIDTSFERYDLAWILRFIADMLEE